MSALQLLKADEPSRKDVFRLRDDIYFSGFTYIEVAFEAYRIYRDESKRRFERHVGPYSFMYLIQGYSERYELVTFLEVAFLRLQKNHEPRERKS